MLREHFDAVERALLSQAAIPANAGHSLHVGTPREGFVRSFLAGHLGDRLAIGTGEIIDAASQPRDRRPQHDVILYRPEYPKVDFGSGLSAFLAESVVATIEVKSTLDPDGIEQATKAARYAKGLKRSLLQALTAGHQPPAIVSFVMAYDGPAKSATVKGWLEGAAKQEGFAYPALPQDATRERIASPALDAVFTLGKGFVYYDNVPIGLAQPDRATNPIRWVHSDTRDGNLFLFWVFLISTMLGVSSSWLQPLPYLANAQYPDAKWAS